MTSLLHVLGIALGEFSECFKDLPSMCHVLPFSADLVGGANLRVLDVDPLVRVLEGIIGSSTCFIIHCSMVTSNGEAST